MRAILNIVWLVLAGFWLAIGYTLAGLVMLIPIITIPFSVQAFKLASYALWPFGRAAVRTHGVRPASAVGNVIWILVAGWWLAVEHLITGLFLAITVIGLPLAFANFKMIPLALTPFGRAIVPVEADPDVQHPPLATPE